MKFRLYQFRIKNYVLYIEQLPAPALARGLCLLEQLATDGQASLETLAKRNGWPKSSTLRYLQTLSELGAVRQHPETLHWHGEMQLRPLTGRLPSSLELLRARLPLLANETGHCAELYRVGSRMVSLVDRAEPDASEIQLNARIGFKRDLRELDATSSLFFAFCTASPPADMWWWQDGERVSVSAEVRDCHLAKVQTAGVSVDHAFNENGVRRFAVPVQEGGSLIGILAVAQRLTPKFRTEGERIREVLEPLVGLPSPDLFQQTLHPEPHPST